MSHKTATVKITNISLTNFKTISIYFRACEHYVTIIKNNTNNILIKKKIQEIDASANMIHLIRQNSEDPNI